MAEAHRCEGHPQAREEASATRKVATTNTAPRMHAADPLRAGQEKFDTVIQKALVVQCTIYLKTAPFV